MAHPSQQTARNDPLSQVRVLTPTDPSYRQVSAPLLWVSRLSIVAEASSLLTRALRLTVQGMPIATTSALAVMCGY